MYMADNEEYSGNKISNDIDFQIIEFLRQDGRMPFSQIATQLNISPGTVRHHYNKLIEKGALQIAAISNPLLFGQSRMAMIGIRADGYRLKETANEIAAYEEISYLVILTGQYDFIAEVVCKDKEHLLDFLTNKLYKVKGVKDTETFMFLEIVKESYI